MILAVRSWAKGGGRALTIALPCLAALAAAACTPAPIPAPSDTPFYGQLAQGQKFGVEIGQPRRFLPRDHFEYVGEFACNKIRADHFKCAPDGRYDVYRASLFPRHGGVYVRVENDRVAAIAWDLYLLPSFDFCIEGAGFCRNYAASPTSHPVLPGLAPGTH